MKHHVLYVHDKARNERRPLASREDGDPNMADDFAVLRQDAIREARARGAERPEFEVVVEVDGVAVKKKEA